MSLLKCGQGVTVDDPYETCFAFLCMIEAGSDLPWLYSPALAVLFAAASKLPWCMAAPGIPGLYEICYGDGEADINDDTFDLATSWGPYEKRAGLYELKYRPDIMPHPLDPEGPYRAVNMPQLVFGLTGLIMPRQCGGVSDTGRYPGGGSPRMGAISASCRGISVDGFFAR